MKNNKFLRYYYSHHFFKDFVLLYPVYMLLFESKGLSVFDISLLMIIWSIPVFILEIPTGILADRWNRKYMVVLGMAFKAIALFFWLIAEGFILFAIGLVFWGIQETFCSGSTQALLFDQLKTHGQSLEYERIAGKSRFYSGTGIAMSMLSGGYVASVSFELATWVSIFSTIIALLLATQFKEAKREEQEVTHWLEYKTALLLGIKKCKSNRNILLVLLFSSLIAIVPGILEEYDQLYAERIGLTIGLIGVWGAIRTGIEALGNRFAYKVRNRFNTVNRICILSLIGGIFLFIAVHYKTLYLLPLYALFFFLISGGYVLAESMLQREITSRERATILSLNVFLMHLSALVLLSGFTIISRFGGLQAGFKLMAIYTILVSAAFMLITRKNKSKP